MPARPSDCPRCGGSLEAGYVIDKGDYGMRSVPEWAAGDPVTGFWSAGLRLSGKSRLPITTYRCRRCGYLESYA